jgi:hypothetical protein
MKAIPETHTKLDIYVFIFYFFWLSIQDGHHHHRKVFFLSTSKVIEKKLYMNDGYVLYFVAVSFVTKWVMRIHTSKKDR